MSAWLSMQNLEELGMETRWEDTGQAWPSPAAASALRAVLGTCLFTIAWKPSTHSASTSACYRALGAQGIVTPLPFSSCCRLQLRCLHCFVIFLGSVRKQISGFQTFGLPPTARNTFHIGNQYIHVCIHLCE